MLAVLKKVGLDVGLVAAGAGFGFEPAEGPETLVASVLVLAAVAEEYVGVA